MRPERVVAFAPGRVSLLGEHTDYNDGLSLPCSIAAGVTVTAERIEAGGADRRIEVRALDVGEADEFSLDEPAATDGWRAFARGTVAELRRAGIALCPARLTIAGDVPRGAGLGSSAALGVALSLALLRLGGAGARLEPIEIARVCARVENDWVGARTGLLDQIASLCGTREAALMIDFRTLAIETVPLRLDGWRLVTVDSGERHANAASASASPSAGAASSGYNVRRAECARACALLGVESLRDAGAEASERLPEPLRRRVRHVRTENDRVRAGVRCLRSGDLRGLGALLNASHRSLRDDYGVSTPALEAAVGLLVHGGAAGARVIGGGFGGSVLGLMPADAEPPAAARVVEPGPGALACAYNPRL